LQSTLAKSNTPLPELEDAEPAWEILSAVHEEAKQGSGSNVHAGACSAASLHIARTLVNSDTGNYAKIVEYMLRAKRTGSWIGSRRSGIACSCSS